MPGFLIPAPLEQLCTTPLYLVGFVVSKSWFAVS